MSPIESGNPSTESIAKITDITNIDPPHLSFLKKLAPVDAPIDRRQEAITRITEHADSLRAMARGIVSLPMIHSPVDTEDTLNRLNDLNDIQLNTLHQTIFGKPAVAADDSQS